MLVFCFLVLVSLHRFGTTRDVYVGFIGVVEKCEHLVVLALRDLVVLVRMAAGARHRQPHPNRTGRFGTIEGRFDTELLLVDTPFGIRQSLAVKRSG